MSSRLRTAVLLLGAALALAAGGGPVAAHPHMTTPPVDFTLVVQDGDVRALLLVEKWVFSGWGEDPGFVPDLKAPVAPESAVRRVTARVTVEIDGAAVTPVLLALDEPPLDPTFRVPTLKIALRYPTAAPPARIRVTWLDFLGILWESEQQVALQIEAQAHVDTALLTPTEPEYTWRKRPPAAFRTSAPPPPPPPPGARLPLLAGGLALVALLLPFAGPWRRRGPALRLVPSLALLAAAGAAAGLELGQVDSPFGRPEPPTHAQARGVVTALVSNVYRAFDATTEEAIYELVAASVEPSLLDRLYGDVYESLVMRKEGGVVCRVKDVTYGQIDVEFPANGSTTQFDADARWTVRGAMSHMGHTHERVNEYRGRLVVRHDGAAWRLAAVTMLEHRRVDDGKPVALDPPAPPPTPASPGAEGTDPR
jgi:hypothetical protein